MKMESPGSGNGSQIFTSLKYQRTFIAKYYGRTLVERWHTQPMLSWIVAEVKRLGNPRAETVFLTITDASIRGVSVKFGRTVFEHKIKAITKFTQTTDDQKCFAYLAKEIASDISLCHVFQAADETSVSQLFKTLREIVQESSQQSLLPFCMETTGTVPIDALQTGQSQQFEVLYVGKIKVTQKRAQPMFVDDATDKFLDIEFQRQKICLKSNPPVSGQSIKSEILGMKSDLSKLSDEDIDPGGVPKRRLSDTVLEEMLHPLQISVDQVNADTVHDSNGEKNGEPSARRQSSSSIENTSPALCQTSLLSPPAHSLIPHTQSLDTPGRTSVLRDLQNFSFTPDQCCSVVEDGSLHRQTSLPPINPKFFAASPVGFLRPRADSNPFTTMDSCHYNRTMLFLISCSNVCLISTDKKQILFHKDFGDISHCSQGVKHPEHFGIVCRETTLTGMDIYVGYIFQCEAERVVNEIMKTLKQAFHCAFQTSQEKLISNKTFKFCDGCPLYWFHKLCCDIEGLSIEKVQTAVMLQIASLSEREQKDIMSKYQATVVQSQEEQNVVFMMLLRALCEQKQMRHTHIASKQPVKQEAGRKGGLSSFDSFKSMAKKSFPSPFESIFKHSASETSAVTDTFREMTVMKTHSLPLSASHHPEKRASPVHKDVVHPIPNPIAATVLSKNKKTSRVENSEALSKKDEVKSLVTIESSKFTLSATSSVASHPVTGERSLSDTAAVLHDLQLEKSQSKISKCSQSLAHSDLRLNEMTKVSSKASLSPLRNIFLKVGTQNRSSALKGIKEQHSESKKGSWRKSIFYRVQTPVERNVAARGEPVREQMKDNGNDYAKRSSAALRALWKKAIMDQILLIRMEKENKRLQVGQDITFQKRVKLQYDIVRPCPEDAGEKWEKIINSSETVSYSLLEEAVKYGVPLVKRGEIWHFLSQQHCLGRKPPSMDQTPYMELLKRLTPYQHAILIDIGRTYPSHPYYKYSLSPGQLSLFSILKAYSLLDEDVGYCQGLSFLAGVILLHMPEGRAFEMMKHIMFVLGFRNQYKPDMAALQIQMYQLARLTHDFIPEINDHFDKLDISPGLYAAPWFLTFFASHFPIGFVARLLDMVFLQGMNAVFKVAVLLLKIHKPQILACTSFETVVDFLKTTLPSSGHIGMEKVLDEVLMVDVHHQLQTYQIEYMVLKEEMTQQAQDIEPEKAHALETDNKELQRLNMELSEQLQVAQNNVSTLEASVASYQSTVKRLEMRVRSLQDERDALHHSVNILRKRLDNLEMTKTEKPLVEAIPPENCSYDKPILPTNGLSTSEKNSQLDPVNHADQATVTEA